MYWKTSITARKKAHEEENIVESKWRQEVVETHDNLHPEWTWHTKEEMDILLWILDKGWKVLVSSSTWSFPYWAYLLPIISQKNLFHLQFICLLFHFFLLTKTWCFHIFHSDIILIYLFHLYFSLFIINFQFFPPLPFGRYCLQSNYACFEHLPTLATSNFMKTFPCPLLLQLVQNYKISIHLFFFSLNVLLFSTF